MTINASDNTRGYLAGLPWNTLQNYTKISGLFQEKGIPPKITAKSLRWR